MCTTDLKGNIVLCFVLDETEEQIELNKYIAELAHVQLVECEEENCAICKKFSTESEQSVDKVVDKCN